jgi:hypothetical protein
MPKDVVLRVPAYRSLPLSFLRVPHTILLPAGVVARRKALAATLQRHRQVSYFRISNIILLRPVSSTSDHTFSHGNYAGFLSECVRCSRPLFSCAGLSSSTCSQDRCDRSISVSVIPSHHFGSLEIWFDATEMQTVVVLSLRSTRVVSFQGLGVHTTKNTCDRTQQLRRTTTRHNSIIQDFRDLEMYQKKTWEDLHASLSGVPPLIAFSQTLDEHHGDVDHSPSLSHVARRFDSISGPLNYNSSSSHQPEHKLRRIPRVVHDERLGRCKRAYQASTAVHCIPDSAPVGIRTCTPAEKYSMG